jgi:hypothetical protein
MGAFVHDDDDDVHMRGRNKGRPNGNMKAKEKFKKLTKA